MKKGNRQVNNSGHYNVWQIFFLGQTKLFTCVLITYNFYFPPPHRQTSTWCRCQRSWHHSNCHLHPCAHSSHWLLHLADLVWTSDSLLKQEQFSDTRRIHGWLWIAVSIYSLRDSHTWCHLATPMCLLLVRQRVQSNHCFHWKTKSLSRQCSEERERDLSFAGFFLNSPEFSFDVFIFCSIIDGNKICTISHTGSLSCISCCCVCD